MKLTAQDRKVLAALDRHSGGTSYAIAKGAGIHTSSPSETAARHLIKLTKEGMAEHTGTRMFPSWRITEAGRQVLKGGGE
ncbi:putative ArsR family transcriptional regulator [Ochrobactrum sp. RH1CCR137]|nr:MULTISPECIES: hypothetical protein [unclassified Ochrobactrum]MBA8846208.1 putative ArsR family transcriptional regulator [Ochrobactrum sp. RH1CCR137]MBA8858027.1 putative ArsR family transcriptional regulator [Ochrobactrum sp. RH1CCR134]